MAPGRGEFVWELGRVEWTGVAVLCLGAWMVEY